MSKLGVARIVTLALGKCIAIATGDGGTESLGKGNRLTFSLSKKYPVHLFKSIMSICTTQTHVPTFTSTRPWPWSFLNSILIIGGGTPWLSVLETVMSLDIVNTSNGSKNSPLRDLSTRCSTISKSFIHADPFIRDSSPPAEALNFKLLNVVCKQRTVVSTPSPLPQVLVSAE